MEQIGPVNRDWSVLTSENKTNREERGERHLVSGVVVVGRDVERTNQSNKL